LEELLLAFKSKDPLLFRKRVVLDSFLAVVVASATEELLVVSAILVKELLILEVVD
jgi:hypothetical protein